MTRTNEALRQQIQQLEQRLSEARSLESGVLMGESTLAFELRNAIARAASQQERAVLLTGQPGAGLEDVARLLHAQSHHRLQPFVKFNIKALSDQQDQLIELLTTVTTDVTQQPGQLLLQESGTLYIEHIELLSRENQNRLIQHLHKTNSSRQDETTHKPRLWLLMASNESAHKLRQQRLLVSDLWEAIANNHIVLPALSQRKSDIPHMAQFYLQEHAKRLGKHVHSLCPETQLRLEHYHWPGDLAELRDVMEQEVNLTTQSVVTIGPQRLRGGQGPLLGDYYMLGLLRKGGMGEVWRARHKWLKREAALKLIRLDHDMDGQRKQSIIRRFQREAQVTSQLSSPYTVRLYDFGVNATGSLYYAMELLDGIDIQQMVKRYGPMRPERVAALLQPVCRSLAEAHQNQLVHRDIKPSNIFLCQMGLEVDYPKVLDFGVVKDYKAPPLSVHGSSGFIHGTPGFMSPEQIQGKDVQHTSDIYSLGCVAFWCLTGRLLFEGKDVMSILMRHVAEPPPLASHYSPYPIPPELDRLILQCLHPDPMQRPSALELSTQFQMLQWPQPWTHSRAEAWWQNHKLQSPQTQESIPSFLPFH